MGTYNNIWQEDFDSLTNRTTVDNGETAWSVDTSKTHKPIFEVKDGAFFSQNTDGVATWQSETIDISGLSNIAVSLDVWGEGVLDTNERYGDFLEISYILDGQEVSLAQYRGMFNNGNVETVGTEGLNGETLQLVIRTETTDSDEAYLWDNLSVASVTSTNLADSPAPFFWQENFDSLTNGTTIDTGETAWSVDLSQTHKPVFEVRDGAFFSQNTDGIATWRSEIIDISDLSNVALSLDVWGEGVLDTNERYGDFLEVSYILDGQEVSLAQHTGMFNNGDVETVATEGLYGENLQLVIRTETTDIDEAYLWDNLSVTGETNTTTELTNSPESETSTNEPKPVKIGGGGFVTGIVIHPEDADTMYARTDVGGVYRWDAVNQDWHQLLSIESVGQQTSLSVESVVVDPNDTNVVYAATGAYTHTGKGVEVPGHVLKSTDQGNTWQVLDLSVPMGGNEDWRWAGERLAVDPFDSNVIYLGSRLDGLWRSQDGGVSWNQIDTATIPVGETWGETKGVAGVTFVEFDESSPGIVYVGVAGEGVYQTADGGDTWQSLTGLSTALVPQQGEVNGDGELVVTLFDPQSGSSDGGVWKFNGSSWEDVTPTTAKNYAGLAVSQSDPNTLFTVSYPMTPNDIYRSSDGGDTWTALNNQQQGLDWYPDWNFWTLSGDLAVNPTNPDQLWLTNGIGIWQTENAQASTSNWSVQVDGIEETVPFDAVSTPGGVSLITAIADFDGFRHTDLTAVPSKNHSDGGFSTTTSIDYSSGNPNFIVRVGGNQNKPWERQAGFSTDNGITWQNFASIENGTHPNNLSFGNVAVSANNVDNIIWQGTNWASPYYTKDRGQTWNEITYFKEQLGGGVHTHLWNDQQALAADPLIDGTFYMYHHAGGQLVRTQDGGESWAVANQDSLLPKGAWVGANVKTAPGMAGDVWVSLDEKGLYRSSDQGETFSQIVGVEDADAIGFGKSAPGINNPTVFVSGQIEGQMGVFGSTDMGNSWTQFTDLPDQFLGDIRSITGDMNTFGRAYIGAASNGFVYGDL